MARTRTYTHIHICAHRHNDAAEHSTEGKHQSIGYKGEHLTGRSMRGARQ